MIRIRAVKAGKNLSPRLPEIIKTLEELVLAHAGVDAFEEVMKLIYAKLYAEKSAEGISQKLSGDVYKKSDGLRFFFEKAKKEWPGLFEKDEIIELSDAQLELCSKLMGRIELFRTDLEVVDAAFEYLLPKAAKGSRGQYFTPRYVIEMMIRILNPKQDERLTDPACGSGGFLLHALKRTEGKNLEIFGVDYDKRMAKIARAILLACGYGKTNIINGNSLTHLRGLAENSFEVVCTNPPFGGEVREKEILKDYELAKIFGKKRGFVERHILFIEKIIRLLRPGGRAGIVVPQGILNNTNLEHVRRWLYGKARIIGVIGLDRNTFKPHTNVKTSLLFMQKWNEDEKTDYPIFMEVSSKSGKNLSGGVVYKIEKGREIIDSDLAEIAGRFRKFIKKERLGF
jgi:type I restriction enzyme M protein